MKLTEEEIARFWSRVAEPDANGCMVWTSYKNDYGYGQFAFQNRQRGAHRIAWGLAGNELPKWPNVIDHACRNRACCNVAHMRAVPQGDNATIHADRSNVPNKMRAYWATIPADERTRLMKERWVVRRANQQSR